eukprot:scaffold43029_cov95-Skeletonema_marinoi.AAC.1
MIENSKVPINALLSQLLASELSTATDPDLSFRRSANRRLKAGEIGSIISPVMEANLTYYKISVNFCQIAYLESGSSNQSQGCSLDLLLKVSMENKSIMLWDSSG